MVQKLITFSINPPADHWDIWFLIKTFGPGLLSVSISAFIAFCAFCVALNQREIAKNKYDLDLFDKRYKIYNEYNKFLKDFKLIRYKNDKLMIYEIDIVKMRDMYHDIEDIIQRKDILYRDSNEEIISSYIDSMVKIEHRIFSITLLSEALIHIKNFTNPENPTVLHLISRGEENIIININNDRSEIDRNYHSILFKLNKYNNELVAYLKPPLVAYSNNVSEILKMIFTLKI